MIGLTPAQSELLHFLTVRGHDKCPSYDEMRQHLGLASTSGIHRLICALEKRGFIRRIPSYARAIEVLSQSEITVRQFTTKEIVKELEHRGYVVNIRRSDKLPAARLGIGHPPLDRLQAAAGGQDV